MRRFFSHAGKTLLILLGAVIFLLAACTIYHHIMLRVEADKIALNKGTLVEVNGHKMNIYVEGENGDNPVLVFMSGSGTAAPFYDFKPLYALLSDEYRVVVVEKAGYGYSEQSDSPRDINTMLEETRQALALAGVSGPFVLFPHSMSGLEALYWAQLYPDEIEAIVGLDMAVPLWYDKNNYSKSMQTIASIGTWIGLHRLPFVYSIDQVTLTDEEYTQKKLLSYRNGYNRTMLNESILVHENSDTVKQSGFPDVTMLLFTSDGTETGVLWVQCQEEFAEQMSSELIYLDCGHYVHHFEYNNIALKSKSFLQSLD